MGDDLGGSARLPPSKLGWAVKWSQPHPTRKQPPHPGPGPKYAPKDAFLGRGPHGLGAEYTMRPCTYRARPSEKKTRHSHGWEDSPGPKYMLPVPTSPRDGGVGLFPQSPRNLTLGFPPESPGPIYDTRGHMLPLPSVKNGMGAESRWAAVDRLGRRPGPGQYAIDATVGANQNQRAYQFPVQPVNKFGKAERINSKQSPRQGRDAPGPVYKHQPAVGPQVLSHMRNSTKCSFGKAKRPLGYEKQPERW